MWIWRTPLSSPAHALALRPLVRRPFARRHYYWPAGRSPAGVGPAGLQYRPQAFGLDQLTWGDADLQRELRRLKDNSLKIPNLKYIFKIALLRVSPTLTHYSDIVSDISSGRICGIYVLTYYLTFFSEILFDILSGILSGIYSDILSGIYYILILPCHEFGLGVLLFAWINANGLNIHQMLVSHVCTQWLPLPLIPQNGQILNLRVGPEKFSGYWKKQTLAQGLKKDVGGRFRYAVGLQSWVNLIRSHW